MCGGFPTEDISRNVWEVSSGAIKIFSVHCGNCRQVRSEGSDLGRSRTDVHSTQLTLFHVDSGKAFPSRNLWRGPS